MDGGAWWAAVHGVARSRTRLSDFTFSFHFHTLEKEMATHSSVLAWRIPGTGEPGGLPSLGSHSRTQLKQLSSSSSSPRTLKCLLQHHSMKASILQHSAFFMVQFSHSYMTTVKNIALTIWKVKVKVTQSCPTVCDPMDCSPWNSPGQYTGVGSCFLLQGILPT